MHPDQLPERRPAQLRLSPIGGSWFRFDTDPPEAWSWEPFPWPRHRLDSLSGACRVRYAGRSFAGAARERFDAVGRIIAEGDGDHWLVELAGELQVLDLRTEAVLDSLGLDDRANTGRLALDRLDGDGVLDTCGALTDRVLAWFGDQVHGLVYRPRTTPETSANLAFFQHATLEAVDCIRVRDLGDRLYTLVLSHGFHVDAEWWTPPGAGPGP